MNIQNKRIGILGAQRSGFAVAQLIHGQGGCPRISDQRGRDSNSGDLLQWADDHDIPLETGGHSQEFLEDVEMLVLSPGVSVFSPIVQWAQSQNILVVGEIEFAYQFCTKPVIAITGTNGKTTVSHLTTAILTQAGYKVQLCGNVGQPFSNYCLDGSVDYFVLEVSSFQLESLVDKEEERIKNFSPFVAAILNFNQNHLDRHKDLDEYFQAKARIFQNQANTDHAVLNACDERLKNLGQDLQAEVHFFDGNASNPNSAVLQTIGAILNISEEVICEVVDSFQGVEHRLEWVRCVDGVDFVNDSKATTAEAGRWALERLDQPIMMICGGRDKNIDFSVLKNIVAQKVKRIFAIGEAREKIRQTFEDVVDVQECDELTHAVIQARQQASQGDCVVLSPMCASFDMFVNYEERGKTFKHIVENLS